METAKIFENGRSQAVRLPKKFRFNTDEVIVQQLGDAVILVPMESISSGTPVRYQYVSEILAWPR